MAVTQTMWIHGSSVQLENSQIGNGSQLHSLQRLGYFTIVKGFDHDPTYEDPGAGNWYHFSISTPMRPSGDPTRLKAVMLRARGIGAILRSIHVWDGDHNVVRKDDLHLLLHDDKKNLSVERFDIAGAPKIRFAVGVSARFTLGVLSGLGQTMTPGVLKLIAAGAEFA